jgi:hypothetical protein
MSYQRLLSHKLLFELIESYIKHETMFKSQIFENIYLPDIIIHNALKNSEFDSLIKIYPEIKNKIDRFVNMFYAIEKQIKIQSLLKFYSRKLLDENKFIDIQNPKEIIKSCYILMRGEAIVCDPTIFTLNSLFF